MEYRRNWDKLDYYPSVNITHDITDLTTYPVTEPVTALELAEYLLLTISYNQTLLEMLISDARQRLEAASGASLVAHTYKVLFSLYADSYKLPFGGSITTFSTPDGVITDYEYENGYILSPSGQFNEVTYTTVPISVEKTKLSIIRLAAFMYEHRGDELSDSVLSKKAHDLSAPYAVKSWLV